MEINNISAYSFNSKLCKVQDRLDLLKRELRELQEYTTNREDETIEPIHIILNGVQSLIGSIER